MYIYGTVSYFNLKQKCSALRYSGKPGQTCIAPETNKARCWNSGDELSCNHCIFGYKSIDDGYVCKSNVDQGLVEQEVFCRYSSENEMPKIIIENASGDGDFIVRYKTSDDYAEFDDADPNVKEQMLQILKQNCFFDLEIVTTIRMKVVCQNISKEGDGVCRKDYDTPVKGKQYIRYRPDKGKDPKLLFVFEKNIPN